MSSTTIAATRRSLHNLEKSSSIAAISTPCQRTQEVTLVAQLSPTKHRQSGSKRLVVTRPSAKDTDDEWTSQRTSRLFDLLTRPFVLFSPSLGIRLPFALVVTNADQVDSDLENHRVVSSNSVGAGNHHQLIKRNQPIDPDPCLVSLDGLLDALVVVSHLVDQVQRDCLVSHGDDRGGAEYNRSVTLKAVNYFRKRIKPALKRIQKLRVQLNDFNIGQFIGRGACGIVRVVREKAPPHSIYAMKSQYKGTWLYGEPEGTQLLLERTVLSQAAAINNPWLPHLHFAFQDEKQVHLVMDYEPGGDLFIFLSKVGNLLDSKMIQFYAAEVIEAVHSLHRMGYIHCDLKPENFAIERSGHLKLIDFGSVVRLDSDGKCVCPTMVGTKEYLSVELLRQRNRGNKPPVLVGPEYDYWAIGVLLYELYYGISPFYDEDDERMMSKIVKFQEHLKFPATVDIPVPAIQLIRSLVTFPSKRLTYEDIIRHPYFETVDFTNLRKLTPPYLPPVGELDDVGNFSNGPTRVRDETIMDMSNNVTFSPLADNEDQHCSPPQQTKLRQVLGENQSANAADATSNNASPPRTSYDRRIAAIHKTAAQPYEETDEDEEEIEDVEWDGAECVKHLPFIGYTFTPGLMPGWSAGGVKRGSGGENIPHSTTPDTGKRCLDDLVEENKRLRDLVASTSSIYESHNMTLVDTLFGTLDYSKQTEKMKENVVSLSHKIAQGESQQLRELTRRNEALEADLAKFRACAHDVVDLEGVLATLRPTCGLQELDDLRCQLTIARASNLSITLLDVLCRFKKQAGERVVEIETYAKSLETSLLDVKAELDTASHRVQQSLAQCDQLTADNSEVKMQSDLLRKQLDRLRVNYTESEGKCQSLKERLAESEQRNRLLDEKIEELSLPADDDSSGSFQFTPVERAEWYFRENGKRASEVRALHAELTEAKNQVKRMREEQTHHKLTIEESALKERKAQEQHKHWQQRATTLQLGLDASRTKLSECQADQCRLVSLNQSLTREMSELRCRLDELTRQKKAAEEAHNEASVRVKQLEENDCSRKYEDLHVRNQQLLANHKATLAKIDEYRSEIRRLRIDLDDSNKRADDSRRQYEQLKKTSLRQTEMIQTHQDEDLSELRSQLERLRTTNCQLVNERDFENGEVRRLEMELHRQRAISDASQNALKSELYRVTTVTEQQAKLINHMCSMLDTNNRPDARSVQTSRPVGHRLFKTTTMVTGASPFITAASTLFHRRPKSPKAPKKHNSVSDSEDITPTRQSTASSSSAGFASTKQPSRLRKFVSKGRLFKRQATTVVQLDTSSSNHRRRPSSSNGLEHEEEDDLIFRRPLAPCTMPEHYTKSTVSGDNDDEDGLPISAASPSVSASSSQLDDDDELDACDLVSDVESCSAPPSRQQSLPPPGPSSTSCRRSSGRGKKQTAEAFVTTINTADRRNSSSKLLKQFSKILIGKNKRRSSSNHN